MRRINWTRLYVRQERNKLALDKEAAQVVPLIVPYSDECAEHLYGEFVQMLRQAGGHTGIVGLGELDAWRARHPACRDQHPDQLMRAVLEGPFKSDGDLWLARNYLYSAQGARVGLFWQLGK